MIHFKREFLIFSGLLEQYTLSKMAGKKKKGGKKGKKGKKGGGKTKEVQMTAQEAILAYQ